MNNPQFQSAALSYEAAAAAERLTIPVNHELLKAFSFSVRQLSNYLGEAAEDELWRTPLALLKRYRFFMVSAPVPFDLAGLVDRSGLNAIFRNLQMYSDVDRSAATLLSQAADLAARLNVLSDNPLLTALALAFPKGVGGRPLAADPFSSRSGC